MFAFNLIKWISSYNNFALREVDVDWTHTVNQQISTRPEIITYLEVIEPKPFFWSSKQVIWREEKTFEYQHWIDLTNKTKIADCRDAWILRVDFDIQFDDKETEELYREQVQTLINELPEYCKNATKITKTIMKIGDRRANETQLYYKTAFLGKLYKNWILQTLVFPVGLIKLYGWIFEKLGANFLARRFVITKMVSNKNIEVIC